MKCLICGCTEEDCSSCIALTGAPCSWAYPFGLHWICSTCDQSAPKAGPWRKCNGHLNARGFAWASVPASLGPSGM